MKGMQRRRLSGVEIVILVLFVVALGMICWSQIQLFAAHNRDVTRKTAANAIDSYLMTIYHPTHHYFPQTITAADSPGLDQTALVDPNGLPLNAPTSSYRYEPRDCDQTHCQSYTLRADLELENDFVRGS